MRIATLGVTPIPTSTACSLLSLSSTRRLSPFSRDAITPGFSRSSLLLPVAQSAGLCRAGQVVELFPTVSTDIVVREARLQDSWEVAETHCSSFFPEYTFPLDFVLRIDRLVGMCFLGFSLPYGCKRTCFVAVVRNSVNETFGFGQESKHGSFDGTVFLNRECVAGVLIIDTLADFLPRKGPLGQRRAGIAYISNVAVREKFRRKGIAKILVAKAEAEAREWGCRAVALHCELDNLGAAKLYENLGFKCIKVSGAKWPQPKTSPDMEFNFMMKRLKSSNSKI